jgi:4-hydroxy-3-polyprenylbenzoate decarboxylase
MGFLGRVANGISFNLAERAFDVGLTKRVPIILAVREGEFGPIHLENMLKLARLGVRIVPTSPSFYTNPKSKEEIVFTVIGKINEILGIGERPKWEVK